MMVLILLTASIIARVMVKLPWLNAAYRYSDTIRIPIAAEGN